MNYQRKILIETLTVYLVVNVILVGLSLMKPYIGKLWVTSLGGSILIISAFIAGKITSLNNIDMGLKTDSILIDIKIILLTIIIVFPAFVFINHIYQIYFIERSFHFTIRENLCANFINNLLIVALPEEIFFRGFLQSVLNRIYPHKVIFRILSYSNLITSVLFAMGHFFINPRFDRLAVFFPSLLFGYLREIRQNLYPSILIHLISNWLMFLLLGMYR